MNQIVVNGLILNGYQRFARGSLSSKIDMLFQLFDLDGKGGITENELRVVLMSIVTPPNQVMYDPSDPNKIYKPSPIISPNASNMSLKKETSPPNTTDSEPYITKSTKLSTPVGHDEIPSTSDLMMTSTHSLNVNHITNDEDFN